MRGCLPGCANSRQASITSLYSLVRAFPLELLPKSCLSPTAVARERADDPPTLATGIPIAYPRMVFLENWLESKLNPLTALGKTGTLGLSGFVNKFNSDAELLDDLVT